MPLEIEYKTHVESHETVAHALAAAEAECASAVMEINRLFDRPDRSLLKTGCGLRVRSMRPIGAAAPPPVENGLPAATLTFKGPVRGGELKARDEIEVAVDDADAAVKLLEALGFGLCLLYEKIRMSYVVDGCRVELDDLPRLGRYVEIEGPDESAIARVRRRLNLAGAPPINASYPELITEACPAARGQPIVLRFE